jgi:hypothetical protein
LEQLFGLQNIAAWEAYDTPWANPEHVLELHGHPLVRNVNSDQELLAGLWMGLTGGH